MELEILATLLSFIKIACIALIRSIVAINSVSTLAKDDFFLKTRMFTVT